MSRRSGSAVREEAPSREEILAMSLWYPDLSNWPVSTPLLAILADFSARAAQGQDSEMQHQMLVETTEVGWPRALATQVSGQWRMARRREGAQVRLAQALPELAPWLPGSDYLRLVRIQSLLSYLPSLEQRQRCSLPNLLREAALIALVEDEIGVSRTQAFDSSKIQPG